MDNRTLTDEDILVVRSMCRRSFSNNPDLAHDCFLYVWEKLHEDNSRRIGSFRGEASFKTFLQSVTGKLIIDFRRSRFGYKVLPKYYWTFDEINRHVFKLFFYHNLSPGWVENSIQAEFKIPPEEAQIRVDEVEKRIRESRVNMDEIDEKRTVLLGEEVDGIASEGRGANPEESLITTEAKEKKEMVLKVLREEVHRLEEEDILILQLYFEQDLSAREISGAIPGLDQKKVYKRIEKILKSLGKYMREKGITNDDIKEIFEQTL